jgi:penicillin amidase
MSLQSAGAAVYAYSWQALLEQTFKSKVPRSLWVPEAVLEDNSRQMNAILVMLKDPHHALWDDSTTLDKNETRDDVLAIALQKAVRAGTKVQGLDLSKWRWGRMHTMEFQNLTFGKSGIPVIERIFNRGPSSLPEASY